MLVSCASQLVAPHCTQEACHCKLQLTAVMGSHCTILLHASRMQPHVARSLIVIKIYCDDLSFTQKAKANLDI